MKNIVIIPARSGSKRIKKKNIINFFGDPIIGKTIKKIKSFKFFDKIYVSTESPNISKIAKKFGADVIIHRDKKLSKDHVPIFKVVKHAVKQIKKVINNKFLIYLILPTSIFIDKKKIIEAKNSISRSNYLRSCSVTIYRKNIKKSFIKKGKFLDFSNKKSFFSNKFKINNFYYENGQCSIYHIDYFLKKKVKDKTKIILIRTSFKSFKLGVRERFWEILILRQGSFE